MPKRELPWKSAEEFVFARPDYKLLVDELMQEVLAQSPPQGEQTRGMTPQWRVKDASGHEVVFPITLESD